jgi:hypothetical protein
MQSVTVLDIIHPIVLEIAIIQSGAEETEKGSLHIIQQKISNTNYSQNLPARTKVSVLFDNINQFRIWHLPRHWVAR